MGNTGGGRHKNDLPVP